MIKREWQIFLHALQFYTRIPLPNLVYNQTYLHQTTRYFPLIGLIVGGACFIDFWISSLIFQTPIALLISIATGLLITGAFHEDGFMDVCDGFGGGWSKQHIIQIMKDSRVGAFATIGMIVLMGLKITTLYYLVVDANWYEVLVLMLSAHSLSRYIASTFLATHSYTYDATEQSKAKPIATQKPTVLTLCIAGLIAISPLLLFNKPLLLLVLIPMYLTKMALGAFFNKWIQGYTGDCLGATQQITELVFYLSILALWKSI